MHDIAPIAGACVWHGSEMARSARWHRALSPLQIAEIDAALAEARRRGLAWETMEPGDFPLPSFAALAEDIRNELEDGSGIVLLRGLDPRRYALADLKLLYGGLCRQIGTPVFSNRAGEIMREIRDVTRDASRNGGGDVGARYGALPEGGQPGAFLSSYARTLTNRELRFHTDRCDVVALLCVRQAAAGGVSRLCSSPAVHNAMLARRPELCAALYEDMWRSRFGEEDVTDGSSYPLPVWGVAAAKFTSHYSRTFIEVAQRRPAAEVPRLSPAQAEALDLLHALAEELCFDMSFAPGDIQFVNNHVVYHARTAFEDDAAAGADRLLLRLWLAMPNSRPLPAGHEVLWRSTLPGALRGGIGQTQTAPVISAELLHRDAAGHAGQVVVGAEERIRARWRRDEFDVLALAGLHDELRMVGVEHSGVAQLRGLKELGGVELVGFLAAVFPVQAIGNAVPKDEAFGREFVIGGDHGQRLCVQPVRRGRRGGPRPRRAPGR